MKKILMLICLLPMMAFAEAPKAVVPAAAPVAAKEEAKIVAKEAVAPLPETAPVVDPKLLPPTWLEKAMNVAASVPIVGPYVLEAMKWLGVIASILTALVTALLGILLALQKVLSIAKLADLALKIQLFIDGPAMYWLKFFSMYNAKKKEEVVGSP